MVVDSIRSDGNSRTHYLYRDHLGSVVAIGNAEGRVLERLSYDAFGNKREGDTWNALDDVVNDLSVIFASSVTTKGFTDHEHVDHANIIHMGGRIYDPTVGRFVQADPIVQEPDNGQSLNRYTYVFNNPLSCTDPTGYVSCKQEEHLGGPTTCSNSDAPDNNDAPSSGDSDSSQVDTGTVGGYESNSSSGDGVSSGAFDSQSDSGGAIEELIVRGDGSSGPRRPRGSSRLSEEEFKRLVGQGELSRADCQGRCHGIPGRDAFDPLSPERGNALFSSGLSGTGAVIAGIGCSTGLTCVTAGLLATDSARQFDFALKGNDPVERMALSLGASQEQSHAVATGLNYVTAAFSISAAYKSTLMNFNSAHKWLLWRLRLRMG